MTKRFSDQITETRGGEKVTIGQGNTPRNPKTTTNQKSAMGPQNNPINPCTCCDKVHPTGYDWKFQIRFHIKARRLVKKLYGFKGFELPCPKSIRPHHPADSSPRLRYVEYVTSSAWKGLWQKCIRCVCSVSLNRCNHASIGSVMDRYTTALATMCLRRNQRSTKPSNRSGDRHHNQRRLFLRSNAPSINTPMILGVLYRPTSLARKDSGITYNTNIVLMVGVGGLSYGVQGIVNLTMRRNLYEKLLKCNYLSRCNDWLNYRPP